MFETSVEDILNDPEFEGLNKHEIATKLTALMDNMSNSISETNKMIDEHNQKIARNREQTRKILDEITLKQAKPPTNSMH